MNSSLRSYLFFTRSQRLGLFALLGLIAVLQFVYWFADFEPSHVPTEREREWLSLQATVDSVKVAQGRKVPKVYPFNPNFITDFKGYQLGMSVEEIDRLLAFRKQNRYVNSAAEFQRVTLVSDSLLARISPFFKFPDWVTRKNASRSKEFAGFEKQKIVATDINTATQDELMQVYGIGPALSERIIKQREVLGAFVDMKQMNDVWGLSPDVVEKIGKRFAVLEKPAVRKIAINEASLKELAAFPYFRYKLAKSIVTYRSMNGKLHNADDLLKIPEFPADNLVIISLYLEF